MEFPVESFETRQGSHASAAGFTLIELMVTLSLAAILLGIGVPMFRDTVARNRLSAQTNDLVAAMTFARSEAITANRRVSFCRADSVSATDCATADAVWQFWIIRDAAGAVIRRGDIPGYGGAVAVSSTLTNDTVTFASDGLARTNNAVVTGQQIVVCSNHSTTDNKRAITLGAGSRLSTEHASGGC